MSSRTEESRSLALAKVESRTRDQVRYFQGPLRVSVRGQDSSSTAEKLPVEVDHFQKPLQSWLGRWGRKGSDGCGEQVSKKLNLGHSKFTLEEANRQPMLMTVEKTLAEILAENLYIVYIN